MFQEKSLETNTNVGVFRTSPRHSHESGNPVSEVKITDLLPDFLKYAQYELCLSPQTVKKYGYALECIVKEIGDLEVEALTHGHFIELKGKMISRGAGRAHVASRVYSMKSFLRYCREVLRLNVINQKEIKAPRPERRDVIFLTNEEVRQFVDSIKIYNESKGFEGVNLDGLRFRTLVEVLLGTAMRISEALSLDRDSIDLEKREAKIIGKGRKERVVFFTPRSLEWVKFYLKERQDSYRPLFVTRKGQRLHRNDVSRLFVSHRKKAGLNKKVTPHIIRHSVATNLLFNGCPISHVKEILGHDRLETTCTYYLGVDKRKAKEAHGQFLSF